MFTLSGYAEGCALCPSHLSKHCKTFIRALDFRLHRYSFAGVFSDVFIVEIDVFHFDVLLEHRRRRSRDNGHIVLGTVIILIFSI